MMTDYKDGDFVQFKGYLCTITEMKDGIATLSNSYQVALNMLCPVEIGNPLDRTIMLVCDIIRYPDCKTKPIKYYQDCYISQDKTIKDVLNDNPSIKYIHELQDWLHKNAEGFHLVYRYGRNTIINKS